MQIQDEILLASATIWRSSCPTAVASLRTEAFSLMGLAHPDTVSAHCSISRQLILLMAPGQTERCA